MIDPNASQPGFRPFLPSASLRFTRRAVPLAALGLVSACASVRPVEAPLVVQAPAVGRVECAVEEAASFGFYPEEVPIEGDQARLMRRADYTVGDVLREVGTRVVTLGLRGRNRVVTEHVFFTESDGMLRAHLIGEDEQGVPVAAGQDAIDDVNVIVSACSS